MFHGEIRVMIKFLALLFIVVFMLFEPIVNGLLTFGIWGVIVPIIACFFLVSGIVIYKVKREEK